MAYWLQPRYEVTEELVHALYFYDGQKHPDFMPGDRVLLYESQAEGARYTAAKAIVALVTVVGEVEYIGKAAWHRRGARDWDYSQAVRVDMHVPWNRKRSGVPLAQVHAAIGRWSPRFGAKRLTPEQFERLTRLVEERVKESGGYPAEAERETSWGTTP